MIFALCDDVYLHSGNMLVTHQRQASWIPIRDLLAVGIPLFELLNLSNNCIAPLAQLPGYYSETLRPAVRAPCNFHFEIPSCRSSYFRVFAADDKMQF